MSVRYLSVETSTPVSLVLLAAVGCRTTHVPGPAGGAMTPESASPEPAVAARVVDESAPLRVLGDPGSSGHQGPVLALALSPSGDTVATVGNDGRLVLWAVDGGPPRVVRAGQDFGLTAVAFSRDGKRVAVGSGAGTFSDLDGPDDGWSVVEVWDATTRARVYRVKRSRAMVRSLGFAADGQLYVLDDAGELAALDARTGARRSRRHVGEALAASDAPVVVDSVFSPGATALIASLHAGKDRELVVQQMNGKRLTTESLAFPPRAFGFGADGHPWSCEDDRCAAIDLTTRGSVAPGTIPVVEVYAPGDPATAIPRWRGGTLVLDHHHLTCHAFHPDGKRLVACSADGLVRIWDLGTLKREP